MSQRQKVLFLPNPKFREPSQSEVIAAVAPHHDLRIIDYDAPVQPQFEGVNVVIDLGGSMGTRAMADVAGSVKLWQILGTGFDHFDLPYWKKKKIPVANCPGELTGVPLAECAILFMLLLARQWHQSQLNLGCREMCLPSGSELAGRNLFLIGFGASARELALRARAFGMKISAMDIRHISIAERQEFGLESVGKPADLDRFLSQADYVSLHLHLNEGTRHILNGPRLRLMKPTAHLINVARGALVDEKELYDALVEKRIAGAGLDVFNDEPVDPNNPLLKVSSVVATPHIAGVTDGTSRRRAACAAQNVDRISRGMEALYRIDQ
jgi:phosphoglycerate dehydrogenase-like enzyme